MIVLLMQSCIDRAVKLNTKIPFVVNKIERYSNTHSTYYAKSSEVGTYSFWGDLLPIPHIMLPTGYYQISDTIIICKPLN